MSNVNKFGIVLAFLVGSIIGWSVNQGGSGSGSSSVLTKLTDEQLEKQSALVEKEAKLEGRWKATEESMQQTIQRLSSQIDSLGRFTEELNSELEKARALIKSQQAKLDAIGSSQLAVQPALTSPPAVPVPQQLENVRRQRPNWDWVHMTPANRTREFIQSLYYDFSHKVFCQYQQDGLLMGILTAVGVTNRFFVEFGFNVATYSEQQSGPNTAVLVMMGWKGLLLDLDHSNPAINLHSLRITPDNIGPTFTEHQVPKELDYLSVDMDSHDVLVLEGIFKAGYRPRVFVIEVNFFFAAMSRQHLPLSQAPTFNPPWAQDRVCYHLGQSLGAVWLLAQEHGYSMVAFSFDAFFVRNDVFKEAGFEPEEAMTPADVRTWMGLPGVDDPCVNVEKVPSDAWLTYTPKDETLLQKMKQDRQHFPSDHVNADKYVRSPVR